MGLTLRHGVNFDAGSSKGPVHNREGFGGKRLGSSLRASTPPSNPLFGYPFSAILPLSIQETSWSTTSRIVALSIRPYILIQHDVKTDTTPSFFAGNGGTCSSSCFLFSDNAERLVDSCALFFHGINGGEFV